MQQFDGIEYGRSAAVVAGLAAQLRAVSRSLAVTIMVLAALVLVGRLAADQALPSFVEAVTFSTTSAWLFLLSSLALRLEDAGGGTLRRYGYLCALGALAGAGICMGALAGYGLADAAQTGLGLDDGSFMSPQAGIAFVLLAVSLLILDWETQAGVRPAQYAALGVGTIGLVTVVGYLNSVPAVYQPTAFHPISIHEAIALILLAAAVLAARPERGILRVVISDTAGGFLARSTPAVVILVPMAAGWFALKGLRLEWYGEGAAISLLVFGTMVFFSILILRIARTLDKADQRHAGAEELLRLRARQRAAVAELSQRALAGADSMSLARESVLLVVDALRVTAGEFLGIDGDEGPLVVQVGMGPELSGGADQSPLAARVMVSGQPLVIDDLPAEVQSQEPRLETLGMMSAALIPVLSSTQMYGVLAAYATEPRSFTEDDIHLLQTVAAILAAARDRATAEGAVRLSEQKFAGLFRSSPDAIAVVRVADRRVLEVNDGFEQMTGYAREEVLGSSINDLNLWNEPMAIVGDTETNPSVRNMELPFKVRSGDVRTGLCSTEVVTLAGESCLLIVVRDISERKRVQAAIQEANDRLARWVNELEDRGREISVLSEMGELLQSCVSQEEACRISVNVAQQLLPGSSGALCLFTDNGMLLEAAGVWGGLSPEEAMFSPDDCWALRRGRAHAASDSDTGPVCAHVKQTQARTHLCVPMVAQSGAIGVLHVRQSDQAFPGDTMTAWLSEPKQRLVVTIADHTALALANLRLRDTLRSQSIRDQLTGLFNRRYMQEVLGRELLRARRAQSSIGILMLDLDRFKAVNDTHGHAAGDEVLKRMSRLLQNRARAEDIVCRYGGEEFVVVLPQMTLQGAMDRAEQIRAATKRIVFNFQDRTIGPLSVSIGVAAFPEHGGSLDSLLTAADAALYRAKVRRDCVELAVPHVGSWPENETQVENDPPQIPERKPVRKSKVVDHGDRLW
jgi:diguanylate cyclase (GGDEF)-like protein/PAS domain S-box-containing protein